MIKISSKSEKVEKFKIEYGFGALPKSVIIEPGQNEIDDETYSHLIGDNDFAQLLRSNVFAVETVKPAKPVKDGAI